MIITILTLFPKVFSDLFSSSIIGRAQKKGLIKIRIVDIRDFAADKHKTVDDKPYGGGVGMLMRIDIVYKAIQAVKIKRGQEKIILLDPTGKKFTQKIANDLKRLQHLILICGHYEGIDRRIQYFVDERISVGDYILTGGEIPAMVVTDCITRLIPKVLGKKEAIIDESFSRQNYYEAPQYTRPLNFKGKRVPKILLSGHHLNIQKWKEKHCVKKKLY